MKKVLLLLILSSCAYKQYIAVESATGIPKGAKEILVQTTKDKALSAFRGASLLYSCNESGCQTEDILIDEGTRARYTIIEMDSVVKVIPYWAITDRVRQDIAIYAGYGTASTFTGEWQRVVYNWDEKRPKAVFDYAVQILKPTGKVAYR